jgi:hypothetical protein
MVSIGNGLGRNVPVVKEVEKKGYDEQETECRVVQLESKFSSMYVLVIHRAPTGDLKLFLTKLESIINYLYKHRSDFVFCGYININYLTESYHKQCLNSLLTSFNLTSVVNFPRRIQNEPSVATDSVCTDSSRK